GVGQHRLDEGPEKPRAFGSADHVREYAGGVTLGRLCRDARADEREVRAVELVVANGANARVDAGVREGARRIDGAPVVRHVADLAERGVPVEVPREGKRGVIRGVATRG